MHAWVIIIKFTLMTLNLIQKLSEKSKVVLDVVSNQTINHKGEP